MKHLLKVILAVLLVPAGAFSANPPEGPTVLHRVKVQKLTFSFEASPRFRAQVDRPRRSDPRQWLMIEAELDLETTLENKFIPELTATWRVVLDSAFEKRPAEQAIQLQGSITYQHLRTHEGTIHLVAYVHPDTIEMITGKDEPGRHEIRAVAVDVMGPDLSQIGKRRRSLWKAIGDGANTRWWDQWNRKVMNEAIVPLTRTPFLPIWADHYPQVKPD